MGCPFHGDGDSSENAPEREGEGEPTADEPNDGRAPSVGRRDFMRSALAIGGASALSTTVGLFGLPDRAAASNTVTIAERANRQHSWNAYERTDRGTFLPPEHHLLLFADYQADGEPSPGHRKEAGEVFERLEEALEWDHEGLLFTVGYSVSYFDRFDEDPPRGLQPGNGAIPRMITGQGLIDGPTIPILPQLNGGEGGTLDLKVTLPREDPVADDDYDVCLHLASDHVQNLLAAEQALWGEKKELNGVSFRDANLKGIFSRPTEYPHRRVGFVGNESLDENIDDVGAEESQAREEFEESVDQGAELSMGYNDLYKNSMPREDNATILEDQRFLPGPENWQPPGVFANGSIMHVSHLENDLEGWYGENDDTERRHRMFSPHHDEDDVGNVGENLGDSNAPDETKDYPMRDFTNPTTDVAQRTEEDFTAGNNIGHAQKTARARAQLEAHFRNDSDSGQPLLDVPQRDDPVAQERDDALANTDGEQNVETGFLRRDFNTIDNGQPGTHFVALQAFSIYIAYVRHAMNGVDFNTAAIGQPTTAPEGVPDTALGFEHEADDGENPEHGILEYVTTLRRGNFILPPIRQRALPHARAIRLVGADSDPETKTYDEAPFPETPLPQYRDPDGEFRVVETGDTYRVTVKDRQLGNRIDPESVRFGYYRNVNAGGGAEPASVDRSGGKTTFVFASGETDIDEDDAARARLYAERRSDRKPVFGTTTAPFSAPDTSNGSQGKGR